MVEEKADTEVGRHTEKMMQTHKDVERRNTTDKKCKPNQMIFGEIGIKDWIDWKLNAMKSSLVKKAKDDVI